MTATAHTGATALPVRPGEKRWTEAELGEVRDQLEAEAAELRLDIERAETDIAVRLGDAVGDAGDDQADVGAKTFEREHELALTHNARELLAQNERAIARIIGDVWLSNLVAWVTRRASANDVASHLELAARLLLR